MVGLPIIRQSVSALIHAVKGVGRLFPFGGVQHAAPGLKLVRDDGHTEYCGFLIDLDEATVTMVAGPSRDMTENPRVTDGIWRMRK